MAHSWHGDGGAQVHFHCGIFVWAVSCAWSTCFPDLLQTVPSHSFGHISNAGFSEKTSLSTQPSGDPLFRPITLSHIPSLIFLVAFTTMWHNLFADCPSPLTENMNFMRVGLLLGPIGPPGPGIHWALSKGLLNECLNMAHF